MMSKKEPKVLANKGSSRNNDEGALDLPDLGVGAAAAVAVARVDGVPVSASGRDAFNSKVHAQERDEANHQVVPEEDDDDDTVGSDSGNDSGTASTAANSAAALEEEEEEEEDKEDKKEIRKARKKRSKTTSETETSLFVRSGYLFLWHMLCVAIYLLPILSPNEYQPGGGELLPVLDELHITQESNRDVNGETTLFTIFTNDYWGRPMQSASR